MTEKLEVSTNHLGRYCSHRLQELGFNALVIFGPIHPNFTYDFGRVVQIRKKAGAFGSDTVLCRMSDGELKSYHNMSFFEIAEPYLQDYKEAMAEADKESVDIDTGFTEYSICGKDYAKGFIVENPTDTASIPDDYPTTLITIFKSQTDED